MFWLSAVAGGRWEDRASTCLECFAAMLCIQHRHGGSAIHVDRRRKLVDAIVSSRFDRGVGLDMSLFAGDTVCVLTSSRFVVFEACVQGR